MVDYTKLIEKYSIKTLAINFVSVRPVWMSIFAIFDAFFFHVPLMNDRNTFAHSRTSRKKAKKNGIGPRSEVRIREYNLKFIVDKMKCYFTRFTLRPRYTFYEFMYVVKVSFIFCRQCREYFSKIALWTTHLLVRQKNKFSIHNTKYTLYIGIDGWGEGVTVLFVDKNEFVRGSFDYN